MKFFIKAASLVVLMISLTFSACGGGGDAGGTEIPVSTLFANKSTIAPGIECPAGGIRIDMGFDVNKNNILDDEEITKFEYVCNGEDASSHPFVVYTTPTPNETDVELDSVISAVFNTEMDETTITDQTFTVTDSIGNSVAGTVSYSGIVAVFKPTDPLVINKKYTVTLASTIENDNDIAMDYDHKIYFTGGKAAVIYKANGATGGDVPVNATRYVTGGTVNASANTGSLVKAGYSFSGWNTEADGSGTPYTVNAQINITTTSVILYAMWTTAYTVTYHANGGTGTLPTDSNLYIYGDDVTVKANIDLVNGGLHFAGWSKNADGSGDNYTANSVFQMGNENVTLFAKWVSGFTVTYDGNGADSGSVPSDSNDYTYGENVYVKTYINLLKDGHHFAFWNTKQDGTGTNYALNAVFSMGNANITLYAKWVVGGDYTSVNIGTLRYIPAGSFQRDATPTNISTITTPFRMSEKEITRAQFLAIMGIDPTDTTYSSGTNDPVQMVTWYDTVEFCNKLSISESLTPVYTITGRTPATGYPITNATVTANWSANGYRLPTEMEWMWAAMGATSGSGYTSPVYLRGYGKLFAGSNSVLADGTGGTNVLGDYAWWGYTSGNAGTTTHPVGTRYANELGLYDMSGNVQEWCWDWYGNYTAGTVTSDSAAGKGAASGTYRVDRGGSFNGGASYCPVARRSCDGPNGRGSGIGFRVVRP